MDERLWTNESPEPGQTTEYPGLTVTCTAPGGALMISGDLSAALTALSPGAPFVGCGGDAPDGPHAIRIARDRAVLITPEPLDAVPGWYGTHALSTADDLFSTITLSGPRAEEIAAACTATPLDGSSPSAMTLFAGVGALVTRQGSALTVRVQRPEAARVLSAISRLVGTVSNTWPETGRAAM